jgi:ABC-type amino acid transport substrate-binding protein
LVLTIIIIVKGEEEMKRTMRNRFVRRTLTLFTCLIMVVALGRPGGVHSQEEEYPGQGKDQLVDALDASIARVIESGQYRDIINSDPVAGPLIVNIADCYPRIVDGEDEIYPFPENPVGLLGDILSNREIKMGTFDVVDTPGTFHAFDIINPALMRAIIDELGKGYNMPPSPDPGAIQIVPVIIPVPSSSLVFTGLKNGDFDITDFLGALGATASVDGVEQRRRKMARFTCTAFGTAWYIHVKDNSSYQTFDDVQEDTTADICVGQLSSRLSEDFFHNASSVTKKFTTDDLVECSQGVLDGTYDAYLHFDPEPYLPGMKTIPMQIVSGIPIWVAGDEPGSTTTTSTGKTCFLEDLYSGSSEKTTLLRNFRDEVLSRTAAGRELIKLYYQWSPAIGVAMVQDESLKQDVQSMVDDMLPLVKRMVD